MSDLEHFGGFEEGSEAISAEALERFKEKMRQSGAQVKAIQAGEQKQKKKEDKLIQIIIKFLQSGQRSEIMLLVVRCLEQDIPAIFVLSLLLLGDKGIQQELGVFLLPQHFGPEGEQKEHSQALALMGVEDPTLPLKAKIEIDNWIGNITKTADEKSSQLLETIQDEDGMIKLIVLQLTSFILRDFLIEHGISPEYEKVKEFSMLILDGIRKKLLLNKKDQDLTKE